MEVDDAADIRASVSDPARFEAIFERHHRVVWTYLARLGGRELADDLAGEVFLRAFAGRETFDPELGAVRSWLYGIATNLWRTHARSTTRGRAALERAWIAQGAPPSGEDDVDAAVDAERSVPHVLRALRSLSAADQAIVALYAVGAAVGLPAAITVALVLAANRGAGDIDASRHHVATTLAVLLELLVAIVFLSFAANLVSHDLAAVPLVAVAVAAYGWLDARLLRWATRILANTWTRAWGWEAVR